MDTLEQYRELRLTLADAIRAQLHLARERHDPVAEEASRALLARLAQDTFTVAVVGQFSRGKTTLLNALLGAEYLPTGALPLTSVLTRIEYGSTPEAAYRRRGSDTVLPIAVSEVPDLVARAGTRRAELQVTAVEIRLPAELLRLGVTFVDTPGVGGSDAGTSAITYGFLPDADAVLFVTSADSALNATDLTLLEQVPAQTHVFCVVNKRDLVGPDEEDAVVRAVRRALAGQWPQDTAEVFPLSALHGLQARLRLIPDPAADDGGVADFETRLAAFLTASRAPMALRNVLDRARTIADGQETLLALAQRAPAHPQAAVDTAAARSASAAARDEILHRIGESAAARVATFQDDEEPSWRVAVTALLDDPDLPARVGDWARARSGEATDQVIGAAAEHLAALGATAEQPLRAALRAAGIAATRLHARPWDVASLPRISTTPPEPPNPAAEQVPAWLPGSAHREAVRRGQAIDGFFDAFRSRMDAGVDQWVRALTAETRRRVEGEEKRLDACLTEPATAAQAETLARIRRRLDEVGETLPRLVASAPDVAVSVAPERESVHGHPELRCLVCERQRRALVADLAHRQFALATREADQESLAHGHGLCPAHTWSYATMTSPLGISAAYAPVSREIARVLRTSRPDAALVPTGGCPVCARIADAETAAFAELASAPDAVVCLPHLARAARHGLDTATVRALRRRLADALDRHAQDMRAYALKREALARGLLTAEERRAHQETLLLLAGDPALAGPLMSENDELEFGS